MNIGVMQGRLSPRLENKPYQYFPIDTWKQEFEIAGSLGFDYIELIYDNSFGIYKFIDYVEEIITLTKKTGIKTTALCLDSFLSGINQETKIEDLMKVLSFGKKIGLKIITLPYIETNNLETQEDVDKLLELLRVCEWTAEKNNIKICLELDLPFEMYRKLGNNIRVTYDTGNYAYYKLGNSIIKYFNNQHVHIKDRLETGESCLIGSGTVKWNEVLPILINYNKIENFTLQGCRSNIYNSLEAEVNIVKQQLNTFKEILKEIK